MVEVSIPLDAGEVTADWLSAALSVGGRDVGVEAVEHERVVHGAGTKLRLHVHYRYGARDFPRRLWVKSGWEDHSPLMEAAGVYVREALFYERYAGAVGSRAPRCYFAMHDAAGRSVVVIEDLGERKADLWDCSVPRSVDDVANLLQTLARLHARWWQDDAMMSMPGIEVPVDPAGPTAVWPRANGGQRLRDILAGPRGRLIPASVRDAERIEVAFWRMVDTLDRPRGRCMLHGDSHPGNCFSDADGAGLFDWQTIARGPWAYDVSYLLATTLSPTNRRYAERDLIAQYLGALRLAGVADAPSPDEAWEDYRRYIAYPLLIWPTNHVSHQSEDNICALTERLGAAAADLKFLEAWSA